MLGLSSVDRSASPPQVAIPRRYNAAHDLIERNLRAGRADKLAYIDDQGEYTYGELAQRVDRAVGALRGLGLEPEQRVLLCMTDTIDFPTVFLGSIKAGIIPVAVNTMLRVQDYEHLLADSRAQAVVVSASLYPILKPALAGSAVRHVLVSQGDIPGTHSLARLLEAAPREPVAPQETCAEEPCFWLYSSGSTGQPKGTVHAHESLILTAELYAGPILGMGEQDVVFSAAKLFFAYGLGNSLTFPLAFGATTVLMAERPSPEAVYARLRQHRPTLFCGVPTLYASLLAATDAPARHELQLRACVSAGECLPPPIGEAWLRRFGVDILDGIGSTEMLHIFLSNRLGEVQYGTTGTPVPGYEVRLLDEEGHPVREGEIGELQVSGPTAAIHYWNNREKSRNTFHGPWTRTGDKYYRSPQGRYVHAGRTDDMLKVSGIYVSPIEVETALLSHPAVHEVAVIGKADDSGLIKPLAFVVARPGTNVDPALGESLKQHVKDKIAPYKYPRWIEFLPELPKTATGKIQRFRLREMIQRPPPTPPRG
jgi:benzoate-CoA ligase